MCWTCIALGPMVSQVEGRPDRSYHSCSHCFPAPRSPGLRRLPVDKQARHYLKDIIRELPFLEAIDVDGDGNCLAHALSRCMTGSEILFSALRSDLAEELFTNIEFYEEALRGKYPEDSLHEELCSAADEAEDDGTKNDYGHGKELSPLHVFGLANMLRRPIILYSAPDDFVNSNAAVYLPARTGEARLPDGNPIGPLLVSWSSSAKHHFVSLIPAPETQQEQFRIPAAALPRNPENGEILVFAYGQTECNSYMQDGAFIFRASEPREEHHIQTQLPVWKELWQETNPDQSWDLARIVGQSRYNQRKDFMRQALMLSMTKDELEMEEREEEEAEESNRLIILLPGKDDSDERGLKRLRILPEKDSNSDDSGETGVHRVLQVSGLLNMLTNSLQENDAAELLRGFSDAAKAHQTMLDVQPNMNLVRNLTSMGFEEAIVCKACVATRNQGIDAALEWILENPAEADGHEVSSSTSESPSKLQSCVKWQSEDPRTGQWIQYDETAADSLESQYQSGKRAGKIHVAGREFTIDFTPGAMEQINNMGYGRAVQRIAPQEMLPDDGALSFSDEEDLKPEAPVEANTSSAVNLKLEAPVEADSSLLGNLKPEAPVEANISSVEAAESVETTLGSEVVVDLEMPQLGEQQGGMNTGASWCHPKEFADSILRSQEAVPSVFILAASNSSDERNYSRFEIGVDSVGYESSSKARLLSESISESVSFGATAFPALVRSVSLQPHGLLGMPLPSEPPKLTRLSSAPARMEWNWSDVLSHKNLHVECN